MEDTTSVLNIINDISTALKTSNYNNEKFALTFFNYQTPALKEYVSRIYYKNKDVSFMISYFDDYARFFVNEEDVSAFFAQKLDYVDILEYNKTSPDERFQIELMMNTKDVFIYNILIELEKLFKTEFGSFIKKQLQNN